MALSPLKRNAFAIAFPSALAGVSTIDQDQIVSVQIPTVTFDTAEHAEANYKVETPTFIDVQDFEIMLMEDNGGELATNFFSEVSPIADDALSGLLQGSSGLNPVADYKFDMIITLYALDRQTVLRQFEISGCWIKQRSYEQSERTSSENLIVTYTIGCTKIVETPGSAL